MDWTVGRAGMLYADLLPDRAGERLLAHRIRIPRGGPAGDWVHYHDVAFQLIVVLRGRVSLVYEDQGPAFWAGPGDAIVQPPTIRHQVLETESGLEVLELVHPPEHTTHADTSLSLPTSHVRPDRTFGGQRFLWDRDRASAWTSHGTVQHRVLEVNEATGGVADVLAWRSDSGGTLEVPCAPGTRVWFVTAGNAVVDGAPVAAGTLVQSERAGPITLAAHTHVLACSLLNAVPTGR